MNMPAVSLAAVRGRRQQTLDVAVEAERRGFTGIYCPSMGDCVALCQAIAQVTNKIEFGTSVQPIHEISNGRFRLGIGVTHGPVHQRLGITPGKPLADIREYVQAMQAASEMHGELPPIILATLRRKMVELSVEIGAGAVWANASRNDFDNSVSDIPADIQNSEFFIGNMIPTVIDADREAGAARNRKTLQGYVSLPNYRNYWKQAGYVEEMEAVEAAIDAGDRDGIMTAMSDEWLSNATLYGSVDQVREGVEEWFDKGCKTPILVPSSTGGGQMHAIQEVFDAFS